MGRDHSCTICGTGGFNSEHDKQLCESLKTKVVNRYKVGTDYDVYIGRPSKWGNPFTHQRKVAAKNQDLTLVENREEAVERYRDYIFDNPKLLADLHELKGKRLGCWCAPAACHGDILAELADSINE